MRAAPLSIEPDFYVIGGTLDPVASCYVERRADDQLNDHLRHGQFCYALTSRQMGKSSLMVRTAVRLRRAGVGVTVLDLTAIGQNVSAEQWYRGLLDVMGQQLALADELIEFWREQKHLGPLQRWMRAIREVVLPRYPGQVVIFVDVDSSTSSAGGLLVGSRGLATVLVVLSVLGPVRDYRYMASFPEWGAYAAGVAPVLAISAAYVVMVVVGHGVMRVVAGPSHADRLARRPLESI